MREKSIAFEMNQGVLLLDNAKIEFVAAVIPEADMDGDFYYKILLENNTYASRLFKTKEEAEQNRIELLELITA